MASSHRTVVVYHGTNWERAGTILFERRLAADAPRVYPQTTPRYVYVTTDFHHAFQYAQNAMDVEAHARRIFPFGNVCVIFRLVVPVSRLLPDQDESDMDNTLEKETGCPFHRADVSRRIAGDVSLDQAAVAWVNPTHPRAKRATAEDVVWHPIPLMYFSRHPLSW